MAFRPAMRADDLWTGEMAGVVIDDKPVLLIRVETGVRAYEDHCAHQRVKLSEGTLDGCVLTCRAHLWQYDVCTGKGVNPDSVSLRAYAVRITDGRIEVDVEAAG
jgi:toluene monooxygenase system ferredoxin subunit